jgi:hypothetical protein
MFIFINYKTIIKLILLKNKINTKGGFDGEVGAKGRCIEEVGASLNFYKL